MPSAVVAYSSKASPCRTYTTASFAMDEAIVGYAERNGYHHIIVGSEGRTGAKRMLLGSVAEDVVTRAHCPVTVVR